MVRVSYLKCCKCNETFDDPASQVDPLDKAYREYRKRHGMLMPEEFREFREKHGFTQKEMGKILGWRDATLPLYEDGALQTDAHEKAYRMAMEPHNLLRLLEKAPEGTIEEEKKTRIMQDIKILREKRGV